MNTRLFVNLPVRDLATAKALYLTTGHEINLAFSDDIAACIVVSASISTTWTDITGK